MMSWLPTYKHSLNFIGSLILAGISVLSLNVHAAIPIGYYDTVDTLSSAALRTSLHEIIDDHQRFPYTASSTDTWNILEAADQDPDNAGNIIDIYKNASYTKVGGGNSFYNREHSWPKSYGFPNDGSTNYPYTDTHHLFLSDIGYNSNRGNKPFDNCNAGCTENVTLFNNNRGGGLTESNWTDVSTWETWNARKGDVARALMYMDVRYAGGNHSITGVAEPDLILTDDRNLISASSTGSNIFVAYMGLKSVLIQWHKDDPVDDFERRHTDSVFSFQGNRNPFIDHPEYVECVFESICTGTGGGDTTPPSPPTGLSGSGGSSLVDLTWTANTETDLAGYNVYRSETSGSGYVKINGSLLSSNSFMDNSVTQAITYYYVVTAVDASSNESGNSGEASAIPDITVPPPPAETTVWINEFHYDNNSTDVGEAIEIAGNANLDLSGWSLVGYNGNGGSTYKTVNLSGVIPAQQNGFGTLNFAFSSMQNGAPDGMALIDNLGAVVQFLSYEGTFTATNGPANGMTSVNVGVSETSSTAVGFSLQLTGTGQSYSDFNWQSASANTFGQPNTGQTFTGTPGQNQAPSAAFSFACPGLSCTFDASGSTDPDGFITGYSWTFGDGSQDLGVNSAYTYNAAGSYNVTLTVTDDQGATAQNTQTVTVADTGGEQSFFENNTVTSIPDNDVMFSDLNVVRSGAAGTVTIAVNITHTYRGDISIILHAPDGSSYTLKSKNGGDSANNVIASYSANVSGNAQGIWTLEIEDNFSRDVGQLNTWSLQF